MLLDARTVGAFGEAMPKANTSCRSFLLLNRNDNDKYSEK